MIDFPNCKINLGLMVKNKRPDGFHEVETILYPVPFFDALEIIPAADGNFSFEITGLKISGDKKANLVVKAYDLLTSEFDLPPVKIHLQKAIPSGAGLGGGSSDAASAAKLINQLFELDLPEANMEELVRPLGSDCAFFIRNSPALATGKGDQLQPLNFSLKGYHIVIVKPDIHINTSDAYRWITPCERETSLSEIIKLPVTEWPGRLVNDFEPAVFEKHPLIRQIRDNLYNAGAEYASLSGSGSAVFGLFKEKPDWELPFKTDFFRQAAL